MEERGLRQSRAAKGPPMSPTFLLTLAVVVAAGCGIATQAPINAALGREIGSTLAAACVSFVVGLAVLVGLTLSLNGTQPFQRLATASPGLLTGGFLGAFFVWAMIWSVPILGALTAFAALVLGQLLTALLLDRIGAFGLPVQEITPPRLVALALVAGGLVLSRL